MHKLGSKFFLFFSVIFFILIVLVNSLFDHEILNGEWDFYLKKTPNQVYKMDSSNVKIAVPSIWNKTVFDLTREAEPRTYGTYRYKKTGLNPNTKYALLIRNTPPTSCAIFVNKVLLEKNGDPFAMATQKSSMKTKSLVKPIYCEFYSDENGYADIAILVTNYFYRKSGILDTVLFGTKDNILKINIIVLTFYTFTAGVLLFIGFFNIAQSLITKSQKAFFYQGILSLSCAIRIMTAEYCSLAVIIPNLPAQLKYKLEYSILWLSPIAVIQILHIIFYGQEKIFNIKESYFRKPIIFVETFIGILSLIIPAKHVNYFVPVMEFFTWVSAAYALAIISSNMLRKEKFIYFYFLGFIVLIIGGAFDFICKKSAGAIPIHFFPFFLILFNFIQILALVEIQNEVYKETKTISGELKKLNEAYLRFVPREFLKLLNKDSATNVCLGDFSKIEMCIIFSKFSIQTKNDISPEYHFKIFNDCLKKVSPVIACYGGFISKFLSGGIMALFPKDQTDALFAAVEMQRIVEKINSKNEDFKITQFIGLHFGKMIIGTIGEENRMDDTVISDTVNTSSRIEGVCERLGKNIILSKAVYDRLNFSRLQKLEFEKLEAVSVKGKEESLQLYACVKKESL